MNIPQDMHVGDAGENNAPLTVENDLNNNNQILKQNGWLCGFRVDNMNKPQVSAHQVACYADGAIPIMEETNDILTEIITTQNKRESNYAHHGWTVDAIATHSPWTLSRIYATSLHNAEGVWVTRRTLATRLRVRVLLEDLVPVPEFETAVEDALAQSTAFEKFQAVYRALNHWGDVVPLEMEMGSSLSLTDTEANFSRLSETAPYNTLSHLSTIKTANIVRKGAVSNVGWDNGTWTMADVPAIEWRPIAIITVAPTIRLLPESLQARLNGLYAQRLSHVPALMIDPIGSQHKVHDDTINASRIISSIKIRGTDYITGLSVHYLDGVVSRGGGNGGNEHTFALTDGEHIVEVLTSSNGDWLRGIQFITDQGRCSPIYGKLEGTPIISRSKGGVLVGFFTGVKKHSEWGDMATRISGIWRHDLIPRAPKENDVYSDYFGARTERGTGFNDRALVGNSSSLYISSVEIHSGADIDSIQFTYTDIKNTQNGKFKTPRHGGSGGCHRRFDLRDGEYIVSVSGKHNGKFLRQLYFGTNLGRTSEVYGQGNDQSFSAKAPLDKNGKSLRLKYILGKSDDRLNGFMFVWTPDL